MLCTFGCQRFATGEDYETGKLFIQLEHLSRQLQLKSQRMRLCRCLKARPLITRPPASAALSEHNAKTLNVVGVAGWRGGRLLDHARLGERSGHRDRERHAHLRGRLLSHIFFSVVKRSSSMFSSRN